MSVDIQTDIFGLLIQAPADPLPNTPPRPSVPYQRESDTSRAAAAKVALRSGTDKFTCFKAILSAHRAGRKITRKLLAAAHFDNQQNRVTGRVLSLIEDGLVYEPLMVEGGGVVRNDRGEMRRQEVDGSRVLFPTPAGLAFAREHSTSFTEDPRG